MTDISGLPALMDSETLIRQEEEEKHKGEENSLPESPTRCTHFRPICENIR
jgi:hypothetical protein